MEPKRDFHYTREHFCNLQRLVNEHTGIALSDAKMDMVYNRLSRRLRQLKMDDFGSYVKLLERGGSDDEYVAFINAITTNLTSFFREGHHFDYLADTLLPDLIQKKRTQRTLRIWSAGCSTGEEPYSIAIVVKEKMPPNWDIKILATDLDSNVISHATAGIYQQERVSGVSPARLSRWFNCGTGSHAGQIRMVPELKQIISFRQLNLMHTWPMRHSFDIIFCRNVVIYFDKPTQTRLFTRYADIMEPEGHLFIGHSESLFKVSDRFRLLGKTVYRKRD